MGIGENIDIYGVCVLMLQMNSYSPCGVYTNLTADQESAQQKQQTRHA